ncbi:Hypothetical protein PHPALM_17516 [Phytophthora palmivora]|uniref:Peptidase S1 domain-containing protein n=1 Tax=Phytophthora palmivora TaxID=4796 RepID=A0A2P4XM20_9STRA|nr:Hypothetical protein PHPALM_17516 [Phytophthora palmivora]
MLNSVVGQHSPLADLSVHGQYPPVDRTIDSPFSRQAERKLIIGGEIVNGTKSYIAGLRYESDGYNFCAGILISPTHLLSASHCVTGPVRWASIGSHYYNGTQDGEQIRVLSVTNHPDYVNDNVHITHDFMVLELERPSRFKPVKLAAIDGSNDKAGVWATSLGWGYTQENGTMSYELKHVKQQVLTNEECMKKMKIDDSVICAGGVTNESTCEGDSGGPLVVESPDGEDVLIGVVSWGNICGKAGEPGAFSRVSSARKWIESITSRSCFK